MSFSWEMNVPYTLDQARASRSLVLLKAAAHAPPLGVGLAWFLAGSCRPAACSAHPGDSLPWVHPSCPHSLPPAGPRGVCEEGGWPVLGLAVRPTPWLECSAAVPRGPLQPALNRKQPGGTCPQSRQPAAVAASAAAAEASCKSHAARATVKLLQRMCPRQSSRATDRQQRRHDSRHSLHRRLVQFLLQKYHTQAPYETSSSTMYPRPSTFQNHSLAIGFPSVTTRPLATQTSVLASASHPPQLTPYMFNDL